ncbi:AraC family transcriptional regulator [Pseudomonas wadenswilerensis]
MYAMTPACTKALCNALAASAVNLDALARIQADLEGGNRIRASLLYELFRDVERLTGNPDIGLLAYRYAHPSICNPFMYCILSAPTLGVAMARMAHYHPLISPGTHLFVERAEDGSVRLSGLELGQATAPRAFLDAGAAMILGLLRWLVPDQEVVPLRVEFTYPRPQRVEQLARCFGPALVFGAVANSLVFPGSLCDLPLPSANPTLDGMLVEHAETLVRDILEGSVSARVRRLLLESWPAQGQPSVAGIAERLKSSPRALQKSLAREATSFKELADECRLTLAYGYLRNSTRSLKYIASALGYTEPSSFNKACQRWFGMSPAQFRRSGPQGGSPLPR